MYAVRFVQAEALPDGHDWALAQDEDTNTCALFVREDAVCPEVLAEAWAGYRRMTRIDEPALPEQRSIERQWEWRMA